MKRAFCGLHTIPAKNGVGENVLISVRKCGKRVARRRINATAVTMP